MMWRLATIGILVAATLASGCAHGRNIQRDMVAPFVSFDEFEDRTLPMEVYLLLVPGGMPSMGKGSTVWEWFYTRAMQTTFKDVEVIHDIREAQKPIPIVRPDLWGFYLGLDIASQLPADNNWNCWIDVRFRFLDRNGHVLATVAAEGIGKNPDQGRATGGALEAIVVKTQKEILDQRRDEVLKLVSRE